MARLDLDVAQVKKLNSDILSDRQDISNYLDTIRNYCEELQNLIGGDVRNFIVSFISNNDSINKNMTIQFEKLVSFLDKQMEGYSDSYAEASEGLKNILDNISKMNINN